MERRQSDRSGRTPQQEQSACQTSNLCGINALGPDAISQAPKPTTRGADVLCIAQ
jgi:hypothetical protein